MLDMQEKEAVLTCRLADTRARPQMGRLLLLTRWPSPLPQKISGNACAAASGALWPPVSSNCFCQFSLVVKTENPAGEQTRQKLTDRDFLLAVPLRVKSEKPTVQVNE